MLASCANEKAVGVVKLEDAWLQHTGCQENGETLQQLVIVMERADASLSEVDLQLLQSDETTLHCQSSLLSIKDNLL